MRQAIREELAAIRAETITAAAEAAAGAKTGATFAVFQAVASLLAVRLLLLLAVVFGFILALMALRAETYQSAGIVVGYAVLIVIPPAEVPGDLPLSADARLAIALPVLAAACVSFCTSVE